MLKVRLLAILIALILLLIPFQSFSQSESIDSTNLEKIFYWFPVKAELKNDPETGKVRYYLKGIGKSIKSGKLLDFEKDLFRRLAHSKRILIGPFAKKSDANRAFSLYKLAKHTNGTIQQEVLAKNDSSITRYYWIYYKIPSKRHSPYFYRTPARTLSGTLSEFKRVLWESTYYETLVFGPFATEDEAKFAKKVYRLE